MRESGLEVEAGHLAPRAVLGKSSGRRAADQEDAPDGPPVHDGEAQETARGGRS